MVERIGDATLFLGDCLDILPTLGPVDAVVTDPPYGVSILRPDGTMGGTSRSVKRWAGQINPVYADFSGDDKPIDPAPLLAIGTEHILWGGNYIANKLPASGAWLTWYKRMNGQSNDFGDCEHAWTDLDMPSKVFQHLWMGMLRASEQGEHHHPTQKPVALMLWCLGFIEGKRVADPYMGSGPVGCACVRLGLQYTGIEKEPKYFDIACKRIEREYAQLKLFPAVEKRESVQLNLEDA
ncbi:MAG: DNA methyltransferase [Terracidiphilus sp.]